jgi:hypothetical protein
VTTKPEKQRVPRPWVTIRSSRTTIDLRIFYASIIVVQHQYFVTRMAAPRWRLTPTGVVAGCGRVARQTIEKGDLIPEEDPLAVCHANIGYTQWAANNFFTNERTKTLGSSRLAQSLNALIPWERAYFNCLFRPAGPGTALAQLVDRFEHNADHFRRNHRIRVVVYQSIYAINHSCVPSATLDIWQVHRSTPSWSSTTNSYEKDPSRHRDPRQLHIRTMDRCLCNTHCRSTSTVAFRLHV